MRVTPIIGLLVALPPLLLTSCDLIGYRAVSIRPTYGWADGCTAVKISGHGFEGTPSATIGGAAVTDIAVPPDEEDSLDVGFWFTAVTPAGTAGLAEVLVTSDGVEDPIPEGFHYVACPSSPYAEYFAPSEGVASGDTVMAGGCGFDAAAQSVELWDPNGVEETATATLTAGCLSADATFTAPDLPDGDYYVVFVDSAGTPLYPADPCDSPPDTGDTCEEPPILTYGGAE